MPRKRNTIKERLQEFQSKCTNTDTAVVQRTVQKALSDRHYLLVKQAAEICEERLFYDLEEYLLAAYQRFLKNPIKNDPHCTAKGAIAHALVALENQEIDFFIAGIRYRQPEPVWGGTEDTAVDLRASCAMGLVNTSYPRALIELVALLHDPEVNARRSAVRAITYTQPMAAEAVLRAKALSGDCEPDVTGEVLSAILKVNPHESVAFVSSLLDACGDPVQRESLALALGESKLDEALVVLRSCWDKEPLKSEQSNVLLLGAIIHRSENAIDWLLEVVVEGDRASARFVIEQIAIYRTDERLSELLQAALTKRADDVLTDLFYEIWR